MSWNKITPVVAWVILASACDSASNDDASSTNAGTSAAQGAAGGTSGAGAGSGASLRCGDFISAAEAATIGLDQFDDTAVQDEPGLGVHCGFDGTVTVSIYPGDRFESSAGGIDRGGLQRLEGPMIGQASHWYESSGLVSVIFLATSGRYHAIMNGPDQATIEPVARSFEPYLNR